METASYLSLWKAWCITFWTAMQMLVTGVILNGNGGQFHV